MTTITYYFQYKEQRKLSSLVNHPLFNRVVDYFLEHQQEEIILRHLKKVFTERNFEQLLDEMIDFKLIERSERRYFLKIRFFNSADFLIQEQSRSRYQEMLTELEALDGSQQALFYGDSLWAALFEEEKDYFFGIISDESEGKQALPFYEKALFGNEQLYFVSVHAKGALSWDLPTYFSYTSSDESSVPQKFSALQQLIGDVDPQYFTVQSLRIIRAVAKNRRIADKRNVFLEALAETGVLMKTDGNWRFQATVSDGEPATTNQFFSEEVTDFAKIEDGNQRMFEKMLFYQHCLQTFLASDSSLFYVVYKPS